MYETVKLGSHVTPTPKPRMEAAVITNILKVNLNVFELEESREMQTSMQTETKP